MFKRPKRPYLFAVTVGLLYSCSALLVAAEDDSISRATFSGEVISDDKEEQISLFTSDHEVDPNEPLGKSVALPSELFLVGLREKRNSHCSFPISWFDAKLTFNAEMPLVHAAANLKNDPQATIFEELIKRGAYEGYCTAAHLALFLYTQNPAIKLKKVLSYFTPLREKYWNNGDETRLYIRLFMTFLLKELFRLGENLDSDQRNDIVLFLLQQGADSNQATLWNAVGKQDVELVRTLLHKAKKNDERFLCALLCEALLLRNLACVDLLTDYIEDSGAPLEPPYYYYYEHYASDLLYDAVYSDDFFRKYYPPSSALYLAAQLDDSNYTMTSKLIEKFTYTPEQLVDAQRGAARSLIEFAQDNKDFEKMLALIVTTTKSLGAIGQVLNEAFFLDIGKNLKKLYRGEDEVDYIKIKEQLRVGLRMLGCYAKAAYDYPSLNGSTDAPRFFSHCNAPESISDYELLWNFICLITDMITGRGPIQFTEIEPKLISYYLCGSSPDAIIREHTGGGDTAWIDCQYDAEYDLSKAKGSLSRVLSYIFFSSYKIGYESALDKYKNSLKELCQFAMDEFTREVLPYIPAYLQTTFWFKKQLFLYRESKGLVPYITQSFDKLFGSNN